MDSVRCTDSLIFFCSFLFFFTTHNTRKCTIPLHLQSNRFAFFLFSHCKQTASLRFANRSAGMRFSLQLIYFDWCVVSHTRHAQFYVHCLLPLPCVIDGRRFAVHLNLCVLNVYCGMYRTIAHIHCEQLHYLIYFVVIMMFGYVVVVFDIETFFLFLFFSFWFEFLKISSHT